MLNKLYRSKAKRICQLLKAMTPKRTQISTGKAFIIIAVVTYSHSECICWCIVWLPMVQADMVAQPWIWILLQVFLDFQQLPNGWFRYVVTQSCIRSQCLCPSSARDISKRRRICIFIFMHPHLSYQLIPRQVSKTSVYFQMTFPSSSLVIVFSVRGQVINFFLN